MGTAVVAGAVPVVLTFVGGGTAVADAEANIAVSRVEYGRGLAAVADESGTDGQSGDAPRWPSAQAPNVRPYQGAHIPDDTYSSLQWVRPLPSADYLSPVDTLHAPTTVDAVPPIAPPPGMLRFGDVRVESPDWLPREQAIQINDGSARTEAELATFLDSVGMERTRSDRVAGQTMGAAALGATAGAVVASPFALIGAGAGGALGLFIGAPFAPIGLAAVPLGAAYGAALMAAPLAVIGAGIGAGMGAAAAVAAPPRTAAPAPRADTATVS